MGVDISDIVPKEKLTLSRLKGKKIAIELYLDLYKYVKASSKPNDHLESLFNMIVTLLNYKIKPCFVLDGKFPEVKRYPKVSNNLNGPRITATITKDIITSTIKLLNAMGMPIIQAPYEAEAQAAYLNQRGDVWAVASHDFDALVYGAPRLIVNLTTAKVRKQGTKKVLTGAFLTELKPTLKKLKISQEQLIMLAMMAGTDFNPGIYDADAKKAYELIKKYEGKEDFMFKRRHWNYAYPWREMFYFLRGNPVTNKYKVRWGRINKEAIKDLLVHQHGLDKKKIEKLLDSI